MSKASELRRQRREKNKTSTARRRAETHSSGFETTCFRMPDGVSFYSPDEGVALVDIVPYIVGDGNPFAEKGDLHYERTYWRYNRIGADEKPYVCSSKTFGKPDFIQEWRQRESKVEESTEMVKLLTPKERQLFLIWDHKAKEKGIQLWEYSYHQFGKLLDERIKTSEESEGWDQFYYADPGGYTLRLTFTEEKPYGIKVTAIDFKPRDDDYVMPDKIKNHGICLDDILIEVPYEKLKSIFLMGEDDGSHRSEKAKSEDREPEKAPFDEEPEAKPAKKHIPTAEEYGLSKGDLVTYNGRRYSIMKISGDGTSLTLYDDNDDSVEKGVGAEEVEKVKEKAEQNGRSKKDKTETQKSSTGSSTGFDDFDDEWE